MGTKTEFKCRSLKVNSTNCKQLATGSQRSRTPPPLVALRTKIRQCNYTKWSEWYKSCAILHRNVKNRSNVGDIPAAALVWYKSKHKHSTERVYPQQVFKRNKTAMFWKCQPNLTTSEAEKTIPCCAGNNYKQHMDICARHPLTNSTFPF